METVDFYPKHFQDIPHQDNPAYGDRECLMIVGDIRDIAVENKHALVLHIIPNPIESVNIVAKFWKHDTAEKFCIEFDAS